LHVLRSIYDILGTVFIGFDFVVVIDLPISVAIELLDLEAVVIDYLILLITLDFVSLAVEIVALQKRYTLLFRSTYHLLLLFGGAGSNLQIVLLVLCDLWMMNGLLGQGLISLRYSLRHLAWDWHLVSYALRLPLLIFLLDRLLDVLSLVRV
jgi:hypothetical protein